MSEPEEREIVPTEVTKMVVDDYLYIGSQLIELRHQDIMDILDFILDITTTIEAEKEEGESL